MENKERKYRRQICIWQQNFQKFFLIFDIHKTYDWESDIFYTFRFAKTDVFSPKELIDWPTWASRR